MHDTSDALFVAVAEIGRSAADRALEIEQTQSIPPDLIERLRQAGFYRLLVPKALGGREAGLFTSLQLLEQLARGDASTAWVAMHGHHAGVLPTRLPQAAYAALYAKGPDVVWANSMTPAGRAERVAGGYRVSGRWPFSSGCEHADWILGLCLETQGGEILPADPAGLAPVLGVVAPAAVWTIERTWRALGLKGTGSHHLALDDVFFGDDCTFRLYASKPAYPGPMYRYGPVLISLHPAAVTAGIAQGAMDDVLKMATAGKRYAFAKQALGDSEVFHHEVGRIEAELRAARALLYAQADRLWARATDGVLDETDMVEAAQARTWIGAACVRVTDACYALGGSTAVLDDCALQRRLRDVHAVAQHVTLNPRQYAFAGARLAGHPAQNPMVFRV